MKIALVTPFPVPLALGGAENLWWGLQTHLQEHTEHECDIVSVLSPESNFWDLMGSYETFSKLDLSQYDCVISGKYPAWMVKHPNHVCYMLHRLRGLYDTYSGAALDIGAQPAEVRSLLEWMALDEFTPDPDRIPELFERVRTLRGNERAEAALGFPGPVSRAIVHFLDNAAMSEMRIRRYAAISSTVARRPGYFPTGAHVEVLYPPPHRDDYVQGRSDYFFTSSRLDGPKRIGLLVDAMRHVSTNIKLKIAGTGPAEATLKTAAAGDPRIEFLGYVADAEMPGLYANARAVPFIPADEDYGLITIEAMRSGKPVVTLSDSGGPTEFVSNGQNGFVVPPDAKSLGQALQTLADDEVQAVAMGQAALARIADINWARVAEGLLSSTEQPHRRIRPKLTVATTFKVYPPMNGGQSRVFHLYSKMARSFDIDIISLGAPGDTRSETEIAPGVLEIVVPRSQPHSDAEYYVSRLVGGKPVSDITTNALYGLTPAYAQALELSAATSQAVIACHPFMVDVIREAAPGVPLWFEAQDVEITLKAAMLGDGPEAHSLLDEVRRAEAVAWRSAERVFACADRDLRALEELYGPTRARLYEVPNGVSLDDVSYIDLAERRRLQAVGGFDSRKIALFLGSWHGPNLEAVEDILRVAPMALGTHFYIVGSVCQPFVTRDLPENVTLMGAVDMATRDLMLAVADVALNPMRSGTGTNLKMLDYMAAGVPVISSRLGARGLNISEGEHFLHAEADDLPAALDKLAGLTEVALASMIGTARQRAVEQYSWQVIADRFVDDLSEG